MRSALYTAVACASASPCVRRQSATSAAPSRTRFRSHSLRVPAMAAAEPKARPPPLDFERIKQLVKDVKKNVVISALPDVYLKLRKRTQLYAVEITVGTDIQVFENEGDKDQVHRNPLKFYKPNLHVEARDRILGGNIGLNTKNNEISYTKAYEVQGLSLGVSALFNYATQTPYAGFILESTTGISSAAKSNSFSINQHISVNDDLGIDLPIETRLDFQGEVKLPGTKYDAVSNSVGLTGPVDIKFHNLIATLTL